MFDTSAFTKSVGKAIARVISSGLIKSRILYSNHYNSYSLLDRDMKLDYPDQYLIYASRTCMLLWKY